MKNYHLLIVAMSLFMIKNSYSQTTVGTVFHANRGTESYWHAYNDNHRALYKIIAGEAYKHINKREKTISRLQNAEDWTNYQKQVRQVLSKPLEKFSKTPLNPQITGIIGRETFTVELIALESHPGYFVTAGLFIPKSRQQPAPAVIYCSGHTALGFRSDTYQHVILNLVNKGFIVLAFDPPGQGERLLYPDSLSGKSKLGGPTTEHSYAGIQTLITGTSISDYFIWDGIRLLDYMETRPEIDMSRIGITGRSGGGTQAAMIAACDDRIYAAAIENYITSFKRLFQSIGPQDAEQNPFNALSQGFDHPDFLHIRAPKPTLMLTTTNDFFSIQGARETFLEGQQSFKVLGKPEHLQMTEDSGGHESTPKNRESLYSFFQTHLKLPGDPDDINTSPLPLAELMVSATGQVKTSFESVSIFDLNKRYLQKLQDDELHSTSQAVKIAGIHPERKLTSAVYTGKFTENNIEVSRHFLENERNDYALPLYVLRNAKSQPYKLIVWFHPGGKQEVLNHKILPGLLDAGYTILSADLPGTGELHDPEYRGDGTVKKVPFNLSFGANLVGKSVSGIQAEAIDLLKQFIESDQQFAISDISALVQGDPAIPFLHFTAMANIFNKTAFIDFPEAGMQLAETEMYNPAEAYYAVPGSILYYNHTDLVSDLVERGTRVMIRRKNENIPGVEQDDLKRLLQFFRD